MRTTNLLTTVFLALFFLVSCKDITEDLNSDDDDDDEMLEEQEEEENSSNTLPTGFSKFKSNVNVYLSGDYVVIESDGTPNHKSPYWGSGDDMYEAYNGSNTAFKQNPNIISEQDYVFKIPKNPSEASNKEATQLGPIGVTISGVPFFNQYAKPPDDLSEEINTFDQYNGHPSQGGQYHYHLEPVYLTSTEGKDALLGYLLDGFPVYGPEENGKTITNNDLDDYHGHTSVTAEYPDGIYHYDITDADPYINGDGFFGTAGTVSQ